METEITTSLEDMLDGAQPAPMLETPAPQDGPTGGKDSAAPPADASHEQTRADDGPLVPRKALEDERRKRQELERRFAEIERQPPQRQQPQHQQPVEMPDPWQDPQGYAQFVAQHAVANARYVADQQAEMRILNRTLHRSERSARKEHGDEVVDAALEAVKQAGLAQKFIAMEDDAFSEMVSWYQDYQIATNPAAYRDKLEAEILAKHGITPQGKAPGQAPKPKSPVPRSLASTASAQPRDTRGRHASEPTPLEDLLP